MVYKVKKFRGVCKDWRLKLRSPLAVLSTEAEFEAF